MYRICRSEQSFKRQREMERGLLQLMLRRKYEDISVSDLCDDMQVPRKAFYRYFSGKDGILYALIDHTLADFFQMPVSEKRTGGTAMGDLDLYFHFWYARKDLLDALHRSNLSGILMERANSFALRENHMPRQFRHLFPEAQSIVMAFSVCGLLAMVLQWHRQGFRFSPEEMTKLATGVLTTPLLNP